MKKLLLLLLPILLVISGCGKSSEVISGYHGCSVNQGFKRSVTVKQEPIGYITYLKIGNVECATDLQVTDPMDLQGNLKVFGVVSWLTWREKPTDPIVFAAQVSGANKDKLLQLGNTDLTGIDIEFSFTLYEYDLGTMAYYKSLGSNSNVLKGTLQKEGESLLFLMSTDAGVDVAAPVNYNFQFGVKAAGAGQEIFKAEFINDSEVKAWGGGK